MNSDIEIIKGRLTLLFKRRPQTRYWLMLSYGLLSLYLNTLLIIYKERQERFLSNPL